MNTADMNNLYRTTAWAQDFISALCERRLARLFFRLIVGRYAYREFIGLQDSVMRFGHNPYWGYGLEKVEYHQDSVPAAWWVEREPKPIKDSQAVTA